MSLLLIGGGGVAGAALGACLSRRNQAWNALAGGATGAMLGWYFSLPAAPEPPAPAPAPGLQDASPPLPWDRSPFLHDTTVYWCYSVLWEDAGAGWIGRGAEMYRSTFASSLSFNPVLMHVSGRVGPTWIRTWVYAGGRWALAMDDRYP